VVSPFSRSVAHALRSVLGLNGLNGRLDRIETQLARLSETLSTMDRTKWTVEQEPPKAPAVAWITTSLPNGTSYELSVDASGHDPYHHAIAMGAPQDATWRFAMQWLRPGEVFFDLGANIGTFSIPAGMLGARVHAFEMLAENIVHLERSINKNGLGDLVVIQAAVGDHRGFAGAAGDSAWGRAVSDAVVQVPTISIDDYAHARGIHQVEVMKIDVEGSEQRALAGSTDLIARCKPDVIMESNTFACGLHGYSYQEILRQLTDAGYRLYRIYQDRLCPWEAGMVQEIAVADYFASVKSHAEITERSGRMISPLSDEEKIRNIVATDHETDTHRKHVLAVSGRLPPTIAGDARVRALLDRWALLANGSRFEIMRIGTA
jgi:FkbM family methyltransferase